MRVRGGHANTVEKFVEPKSTAKRIQVQDTRDCGHMFCSKEHFTFTRGHQKRFTNSNVWTRINLKTDKYLMILDK